MQHAEIKPGLFITRVVSKRGFERLLRSIEIFLPQAVDSKVVPSLRVRRAQTNRPPVGGFRFGVQFLAGVNQAQVEFGLRVIAFAQFERGAIVAHRPR